jgi:hypothetical protein
MKMTMKITFDPMEVAPKAIKEAVLAAGVKPDAITLHSQRETSPDAATKAAVVPITDAVKAVK